MQGPRAPLWQRIWVRTAHFFFNILFSVYGLLALPDVAWDLVFALLLHAVVVHWFVLRRECILNVLDEKIGGPEYKTGAKPYENGYIRDLWSALLESSALDAITKATLSVVGVLAIVNLLVVNLRLFPRLLMNLDKKAVIALAIGDAVIVAGAMLTNSPPSRS